MRTAYGGWNSKLLELMYILARNAAKTAVSSPLTEADS